MTSALHYFGSVTQGWQAPGVIVPQTIYDGSSGSTDGVLSFPPGIPLTQALQLGAGQGFDSRPATTSPNQARMTLRIMWPGYDAWHSNINVRERTPQAEPIPLCLLMRRIAESVRCFHLERAGGASFDPVAGAGWHLQNIPFERLYLLELRQGGYTICALGSSIAPWDHFDTSIAVPLGTASFTFVSARRIPTGGLRTGTMKLLRNRARMSKEQPPHIMDHVLDVIQVCMRTFPHAFCYLKRIQHPVQIQSMFQWLSQFDDGDFECKVSRNRPLRHSYLAQLPIWIHVPEMYYWEFSCVPKTSGVFLKMQAQIVSGHSPIEMAVGFQWDTKNVRYYSNGRITCSDDTVRSVETYEDGDIVGCGFTDRGISVFFTKNGKQIGHVNSGLDRPTWGPPHVDITTRYLEEIKITTEPNFGGRPFKFNIGPYCDSVRQGRGVSIRDGIEHRVPLEIIDDIFLHSVGDTVKGTEDFLALYHLSRVSRFLSRRCTNALLAELWASSRNDIAAVIGLHLLHRTKRLVTEEDPINPWFNYFFAYAFPQQEAEVTHWICDFKNCEPHPPMDISSFIRAHPSLRISRLDLRNRKFRTYGHFARLVFSLSQLEHLGISNVSWATEAPPPRPWSSLSLHLREVHLDFAENLTGGCLRLFLAGIHGGGGDFPAIARIMHALGQLVPDGPGRIVYSHSQDETHRVMVLHGPEYHTPILGFALNKQGAGKGLELSSIVMQIGCEDDPSGIPYCDNRRGWLSRLFNLTSVLDSLDATLRGGIYCLTPRCLEILASLRQKPTYQSKVTIHFAGENPTSSRTETFQRQPGGTVEELSVRKAVSVAVELFAPPPHSHIPATFPGDGSHYFGNVVSGWQPQGIIVPQRIHAAGLATMPGAVVSFRPGIPLVQALQVGPGKELDSRPTTMPLRNRWRLTLRILWPGYASWSGNFNALERTPTVETIPMYKLMRRIAESVQIFYREMVHGPFDRTTGGDWHLNNIPFECLYLLELRQVSDGSWQPVLSYVPAETAS